MRDLVERLRAFTLGFDNPPEVDEAFEAADAIEALVKERDLTHAYACRLLDCLAPGLEKLPRVVGVIDQINNATVWLKTRAEAAEAEAAKLKEALTKIAETGLDTEADTGGDGGYADPDSLILVARRALGEEK